MEVQEPVAIFGTCADDSLQTRAFRDGVGDVLQYHIFACCHYHFYGGGFASVYDVFLREQVRGGDGDRTYLVQCDYGKPELVTAFQNKHDLVTVSYSQTLEP